MKNRPFPPEVGSPGGIGSRPDGIIWSMKSKTVIWIELTSPWEENPLKNDMLKTKRYNQLEIDRARGQVFWGEMDCSAALCGGWSKRSTA